MSCESNTCYYDSLELPVAVDARESVVNDLRRIVVSVAETYNSTVTHSA